MFSKTLVMSICLVFLVSCVSGEQRRLQLSNRDHAECLSYGAQLGSNMYLKCRQMLKQQRIAEQAQFQRANQNLINNGAMMYQMGQPRLYGQ
jgi:hypothetical protein